MSTDTLDTVETWQCAGETFETFRTTVCDFFGWGCEQGSGGDTAFRWQTNLGVLKAHDSRNEPRIWMARLVTASGFVQTQTETGHDVIVIMPVKAQLTLTRDAHSEMVATGRAAVYQPIQETRIEYVANSTCESYVIRLSAGWLQRFLFEVLQMPVEKDLQLGPVLDIETPRARVLAQMAATLCSDVFTGQSRDLSPALQQRLSETFGHILLESVPHRYSARMTTPKSGPMPNYVRLARDYMHREARSNPSMADVARAAGISVRTLATSFRQYLDVTPHAYLRTVRLRMARQALSSRGNGASTAAIAVEFGFPHAGRFAQYYTELFGESPSDTRRKGPQGGNGDDGTFA